MNEQILPVINDYDLVPKTSIRTYMATTWSDKEGPVRLATNVVKKNKLSQGHDDFVQAITRF